MPQAHKELVEVLTSKLLPHLGLPLLACTLNQVSTGQEERSLQGKMKWDGGEEGPHDVV